MKKFVLQELVKPLLHRVGSVAGIGLAALGMPANDVSAVQAALIVLGGFAIDFVVRKVI